GVVGIGDAVRVPAGQGAHADDGAVVAESHRLGAHGGAGAGRDEVAFVVENLAAGDGAVTDGGGDGIGLAVGAKRGTHDGRRAARAYGGGIHALGPGPVAESAALPAVGNAHAADGRGEGAACFGGRAERGGEAAVGLAARAD